MAKKPERFPDEMFLQEALKSGRATIQDISMKAIGTPDTRLQARQEHLSMDHVRSLHELLRIQGKLGPVVVFHSAKTGKIMLADGFHRHDVYRRDGRDSIPAYVVQGEWEDAVDFAAMCNRQLCLARKAGDINKAVFMLLGDERWFNRADMWIASHVGVSQGVVTKYRLEFCDSARKELPKKVVTRDGTSRSYGSDRSHKPKVSKVGGHGSRSFRVEHRGNTLYYGNKEGAQTRADRIIEDQAIYKNTANLVSRLTSRGIFAKPCGGPRSGFRAILVGDYVCSLIRTDNPFLAIACAIGEVTMARAKCGGKKMAILSPPLIANAAHSQVAISAGISVMTFEDLVQAVRRDGDKPRSTAV